VVKLWNIMTAFVVIYIVAVISFDIGFGWWKIAKSMYIIGKLVDAYCWADMVVTFNTGIIHAGHLVLDRRPVARHYFEFWFWVDLAASVPWEGLLNTSKSNRKAAKFIKWFKLPKLLRLGRLRKLMKGNGRYINLVLIISSFCFFIHLGACCWVFLLDACSAYMEMEPFVDWNYRHEVDEIAVQQHPRLGWECMQSNIGYVYSQAIHVSAAMLLGVDKVSFGGYFSGGGESNTLLEEIKSYARHLEDTPESILSDPEAAKMRSIKLWLLRRRYPLSLATVSNFTTDSCGLASVQNSGEINTYGLSMAMPMNIFGACMLMLGLYLQGALFAELTKQLLFRNQAETLFRQAHDEVKREMEVFGHLLPETVCQRVKKTFSIPMDKSGIWAVTAA
jgi:hypothetical protein